MKLSLFLLIIGVTALASFSQADGIESLPIFGGEMKITPSHMKHLKKLVYVLSEPRFNPKGNGQMKDLEKLIVHIEGMKNEENEERARAERGLQDIIKKLKSYIQKFLKKGKSKAKGAKNKFL